MISFTLPERSGHHREYLEFLVNYWQLNEYAVLKSFREKMAAYKRGDTIVMLDIDLSDLRFAIWACIVSTFAKKQPLRLYGLSVRATEFLQEKKSFWNLVVKKGRLYYLKRVVKGYLFKALIRSKRVHIYGIFADFPDQDQLTKYCTSQVHDFQYYDLEYLQRDPKKPKELEGVSISDALVVFTGSNSKRRNILELFRLLGDAKSEQMKILLVGNVDLSEKAFHAQVYQIKRRLSDNELLWCLLNGGCTYCFYSNNAPSGFFGRSVQFGTRVLVKKNSYLDRSFYQNKVAVASLMDLDPEQLLLKREAQGSSIYNLIKLPKPNAF
mgnify:CR=1 FL=1